MAYSQWFTYSTLAKIMDLNVKSKISLIISQFGSVTEVLEVWGQRTDTCDNLGKHTIVTNGLLDNNNPKQGFFIQYGGGDICDADDPIENGKPRKTTFKIYCSNNQDKNVKYIFI